MASEIGKILVVDDNRLNRLKLSISLEQQGHQVSLAEDGGQALSLLKQERFDVVLLDIIMPEMDGYQVLERMKADPDLRAIPVIVISALDEIDSAVRCIEMGAEDYLPKPFNPVLLRARLNSSLGRKKLRDLEQAYLDQEMMLRQSEKLATVGRLSAGMAHELNNPAAAALRGANQLQVMFAHFQALQLSVEMPALIEGHGETLAALGRLAQERAKEPPGLSAMARGDLENELETRLDEIGVAEAWELAPTLANIGLGWDELARLAEGLTQRQFALALAWLADAYSINSLLGEIAEGTGRISQIVKALKAYSYMDQAPVQAVDIHEGLENTLVMLRSKINQGNMVETQNIASLRGIIINRQYAADLPRIQAYGSELNQVWTNIIDNAIDALDGEGEITLRTSSDERWVVVEIEDNGPGIPAEIQSKIYDPFFTTKPVGKGAGLGLNISHNIIVNKHKGQIDVVSQPGRTCFTVWLPIRG